MLKITTYIMEEYDMMDEYFEKIENDIKSKIKKDIPLLENKIIGTIKSKITSSLCDKSYYEYDDIDIKIYNIFMEEFITSQSIHSQHDHSYNKQIEYNKLKIKEFLNFVDGEKIVVFHKYILEIHDHSNEIKIVENDPFTCTPNSLCQCKTNYNNNNNYPSNIYHCNNKKYVKKVYQNHTNNISSYENYKISLQFFFLTNYGRIISNFTDNVNASVYSTISKLNYNNYYYWIPNDFIKIIQKSIPYKIYDILKLILDKLYNRTTFDKKPSNLDIEIKNIKKQNDILTDSIKKINLDNDRILEQTLKLYDEYNELLKIESKYNLLLNNEKSEIDLDIYRSNIIHNKLFSKLCDNCKINICNESLT